VYDHVVILVPVSQWFPQGDTPLYTAGSERANRIDNMKLLGSCEGMYGRAAGQVGLPVRQLL
jgi:hypothetical protein